MRTGPHLKSASTSGPARNRLSCKQEWMSGRSSQPGLDPEQDAKFPAPSLLRLDPPGHPRRHLTDRHSFQTLSTRAAQSKVRRKASARNAALIPRLAGERSIPAVPESEKTGFRFFSVVRGPSQRLPRQNWSEGPALRANKDL